MVTDQPEPDEALVEDVANVIHEHWCGLDVCGALHESEYEGARAAIAAVRAYDLARQPYATTVAGKTTLHWPDGRPGDAIWCSTALIEALIADDAPPAELQAVIVDGVPVPAVTGVPRCPGTVYREHVVGAEHRCTVEPAGPCTLPLGHHGGCR